MRNQDHSPTLLHYAIDRLGASWVLSCENIPVACFESRVQAREAAAAHVAAARRRGDCAILEKDESRATMA